MTPLLQQMADERRARRIRLGMITAPKPQVIEQSKQPEPIVESAPSESPSPIHLPSAQPHALRPFAKTLLDIVARDCGLSVDQILGPKRHPPTVRARHEVIYLLCIAGWSTPKIGRFFHRDHTSIMHARDKIALQRDTNPDLREKLKLLYLEALITEKLHDR